MLHLCLHQVMPWVDVPRHMGSCRHELDITALTGCLEREEKARTQEAAEHATAAAALQKNIADLQASTHCAEYHANILA